MAEEGVREVDDYLSFRMFCEQRQTIYVEPLVIRANIHISRHVCMSINGMGYVTLECSQTPKRDGLIAKISEGSKLHINITAFINEVFEEKVGLH